MRCRPPRQTHESTASAFALPGAAAAASSAEAGGFAVSRQSEADGQGSSFAEIAAPGDSINAMFWIPAAVTIVDGITLEGDLTGVFPRWSLMSIARVRSSPALESPAAAAMSAKANLFPQVISRHRSPTSSTSE